MDRDKVKKALNTLRSDCPECFDLWVKNNQWTPIIMWVSTCYDVNYNELIKFFNNELGIPYMENKELAASYVIKYLTDKNKLCEIQLSESDGELKIGGDSWLGDTLFFKSKSDAKKFIRDNVPEFEKKFIIVPWDSKLAINYITIITKKGMKIDNVSIMPGADWKNMLA